MCDYCSEIGMENELEYPEEVEGIFYNKKENKFYFIVEQARYERTKVEIYYCPMCGTKLT